MYLNNSVQIVSAAWAQMFNVLCYAMNFKNNFLNKTEIRRWILQTNISWPWAQIMMPPGVLLFLFCYDILESFRHIFSIKLRLLKKMKLIWMYLYY